MEADNQSRESTLKEAMTTDQNTFWLIIGMGGGGGCLLAWGTGLDAAVYDFSSQQKAGPLLMINNNATLSKSIKINVEYN